MNKSMVNLKQMYKQLLKAKNAEQEVKVLNKKCKRKETSIKQLEEELGNTWYEVSKLKQEINNLSQLCQSLKNGTPM